MKYPHGWMQIIQMNDINRQSQINKFLILLYVSSFAIGLGLYYYLNPEFMSGFGIGMAGLSVIGILYLFNVDIIEGDKLEDAKSFILFVGILASIIVIIINRVKNGPEIIDGIATAMCLYIAIMYAFVLIRRFTEQI